MSDFLQFKDEVINGTPKYNITDNVDGTKSIELANEVVQSGTALSKNGLNIINTIMGYNECSLTQSQTTTEILFNAKFTPTFSSSIAISNTYKSIGYFDINNSRINVTVKQEGSGFSTITNDSSHTYKLFDYDSELSTNRTDSFSFQSMSANATKIYFHFDKPIKIKKMNHFATAGTVYKLEFLRNDNIVGTYSSVGELSLSNYIEIDTLRYSNYPNNSQSIIIMLKDTIGIIQGIANNFKIDNFSDFVDKQIVNITTPAFLIDEIVSNTFNSKPIDTILQSGKYYELLYDEPNDRFIAHEERV